jgi:hypothetical protein
MVNVTALAGVLQTLLTTKADELARTTKLVVRERNLSGGDWVQTLVFGYLEDPDASLETLSEWAADHDLQISPQGLDGWFCTEGVDCLKQLAPLAVGALIETQPAAVPLLERFNGVYAEDASSVPLPASLHESFPGCGGNDPKGRDQAAVKFYVRWNVSRGHLTDLSIGPGKQADVTAAQEAPQLPKGALRLKDLGYFDTQLLAKDTAAGVWWINRLPSSVYIRVGDDASVQPLAEWLKNQTADKVEVAVQVGTEHPLPCRLLVCRCPEQVRQKRLRQLEKRARKKGRAVSERQRVLCGWTVLITNLAAEQLTMEEAWVLYRVRWQIELLFKLWKSQGRLAKSLGRRGERVLCEVLAKLLTVLVQHWLLLLAGPWLDPLAAKKRLGIVRRRIDQIATALSDLDRLADELDRLQRRLRRLRRRNRRKKKPSTLELLKNPKLANLGVS